MKKYFVIIHNGNKKIASTYKIAESKEWAEAMAEWAFMTRYADVKFTHAEATLVEME